jgi:hypothetical protein
MSHPLSSPPAPPPWPPSPPRRSSGWLAFAFLIIALVVAVGMAIAGWLRSLPDEKRHPTPPASTFTSQQISDAKANVCAAFSKVDHALDVAGARSGGGDPTAQLAVATSTRQALDAGSRYLVTKLNEDPATPSDLADAIRKLSDVYQELTIAYLDGLTNSDPGLQSSLRASDDLTLTIRRLCK